MARLKKDSFIIYSNQLTIGILSLFILAVSAMSATTFYNNLQMKQVISNLAKSREATYENPKYRGKDKRWLDGYYAAVLDKQNIKVFRKFWKSRREWIIMDFFDNKECNGK